MTPRTASKRSETAPESSEIAVTSAATMRAYSTVSMPASSFMNFLKTFDMTLTPCLLLALSRGTSETFYA
jgi:hypothetical protein